MHKHFHRIAWAALALTLAVIVFGAFVRLSDAGLSCPDWPTCYGRATWPTQDAHFQHAQENFERPLETDKAWREQVHRHLAAVLGLGVLALALLAVRRRRFGLAVVLGASALVAVAIPLYMQAQHAAAAVLAGAGMLTLLLAAARWSNSDLARVATLTLAVIVFQALLGMWTVTWLLKPAVVMAHLLGGLLTFALLTFMAWRATPGGGLVHVDAPRLRGLLGVGLALLVAQIALGGWTSANYAALACGTDVPTCLGQWWPDADWREGFVLWRGIGVDYEGGVLDGDARVAIQLAHRIMAVVAGSYLLVVAWSLWRRQGLRRWSALLGAFLVAQVALGVGNVHFGLPLWMAVAHNAGAVALLFVLVSLLTRLRSPR